MSKNDLDKNIKEDELENDNNLQDAEEFVFEDLNEEGEELSQKDKIKKLQEKIKLLTKEKQEYLSGWQRAQADYRNREKQINIERSEYGKYAVKSFVEDLLPILDTYDAARSNKQAWDAVDQNWRAGIEYIFSTFENKLKEHNVEAFALEGDKFDPTKHEPLESVDTEDKSKDETIDKVIMKGYTYGDKVLRPAKVKVFKYNK